MTVRELSLYQICDGLLPREIIPLSFYLLIFFLKQFYSLLKTHLLKWCGMQTLIFEHGTHEAVCEAVWAAFPLEILTCWSICLFLPINRLPDSIGMRSVQRSQVSQKGVFMKAVNFVICVTHHNGGFRWKCNWSVKGVLPWNIHGFFQEICLEFETCVTLWAHSISISVYRVVEFKALILWTSHVLLVYCLF